MGHGTERAEGCLTREQAVAEIVARIEADEAVNVTDYCIGRDAIIAVLEQFKVNRPLPQPEPVDA